MTNKTNTPAPNMSPAVAAVYNRCKGSSTKELKNYYRQVNGPRYMDRPEVAAVRAGLFRLLEDRLGIEQADQFADEVFALVCSQS